jgi:tryptophan 7-halogenase
MNDAPRLTDPRARELWQLVAGLEVPFYYERSFRACRGALLAKRFLLSLSKADLGANPHVKIAELCRHLAMPRAFQSMAARFLGGADFLHFGYEENQASCLYKIYLELGTPSDRAAASAPVLLHIAFKWDAAEPSRAALTRYFWYPALPVSAMLNRVGQIFPPSSAAEPLDIVRGILQLTQGRPFAGSIRYLEVTEDHNARHSFDVNLYDAKLEMKDLCPFFARMCHYHAIPPESLQALIEPDQSKVLGHLAGGTHRQGEQFFNVYYGVQRHQGRAED